MSGMKKVFVVLILVIMLAALAAGLVWNITHYWMVDFRFYSKQAQSLDLRGQDISLSHYDKLHSRLPDCDIRWDIPFQGAVYPDDTTELTVTALSEEDVAALGYFSALQKVDAQGCKDYPQLLAAQDRYPEVNITFDVEINGTGYRYDTKEINLTGITQDELGLLPYLRQLSTVVVSGGEQMENLDQLQTYCHESGLDFFISVNKEKIADDTKKVTLKEPNDGELNLLQLLPDMNQLHLENPKAAADAVIALQDTYPDVEVTWEQEICGKSFELGVEEVDLSDTTIETLDEVEQGMKYFPGTKQVFLGECGLDNEEIADYRERARADYKVVWIVRCGEKLPTRTDTTSFMPSRDGVGYIRDDATVNLRYCEDIIAVDVGHMGVKDVSFVEYMPNLKYLILAHTEVQDITPLSTCKNLVFLELDWSPVKDFTPLQGCTALEDLNIGNTGADVTPIGKMTWLKNLWMIFRGGGSAWEMTQALPNTHVVASGNATVSSGWRRLPNYYAMRDALNMYYMEW